MDNKIEFYESLSSDLRTRLNSICLKLFNIKNEEDVLQALMVKKPNLSSYLDFVYLLLNDESELSKTFWNAFVNAHALNTNVHSSLDIKQLNNLLMLVDENDKKENTDESKRLLNSLKEFISLNGIIHKSSQEHIDFKENINRPKKHQVINGAIAEINIEDDFKISLISHYKQVLLNCILVLHGITPSIHINLEFDKATEPKLDIRDSLSKHNLIRNFDILNQEEKIIIENYQKRRGRSYSELIESYTYSENSNQGASERYHHDYFVRSGTLENYIIQSISSRNKLIFFSRLLVNFKNESIRRYPTFLEFINSSADLNFKVTDKLDSIIIKAFNKLEEMISARLALEQKARWEHEFIDDPAVDLVNDFEPNELDWTEEGYPFYKSELINITINELATIAMLKESKTIRNEMIKNETILKSGVDKDTVTILSARKWLNDERRKYPFFDILERGKLSDELITIDHLREIRHKLRVDQVVKRA